MTENQIKGYQFEIQIRDYIINELNNIAYLWSDVPENILIEACIINSHNENRLNRLKRKTNPIIDTGIDIIQLDKNNNIILVQCKNGYKKGLKVKDLAGFMCWMARLIKLQGYIYHTNKLSSKFKEYTHTDRIIFIEKSFDENINYNITNKNNNLDISINILKLYKYQKEAKNKLLTHFKENNRGILSMPCGTGKTITAYSFSKKYNQIIFISPLIQFSKQNLIRFLEYGLEHNYLLVNSDGERDTKYIKKFIKQNEKFIISLTFNSIDVIINLLKYTVDPIIIIDEFHNLSKSNIFDNSDNNDLLYKLLHSDYKILFMSATPRVYEIEDDDFNYTDIFGPIIYNMNFTDAITNKYITDYKIWIPSINEDNSQLLKELSIYNIDNINKSKCNFLFISIIKTGIKKCIIYCQDNNEIDKFMESMTVLNNFYQLNIEMNKITYEVSSSNRQKILDSFEKGINKQLIFSIRILDECIDIPSCDSIYITYPSQSKIRTIQRISRCIRIDKNNPYKIGNIFIWCDEYDNIIETLSGIKEYDLLFKDKINLIETNFYNKSDHIIYNNDLILINKYILNIVEYRQLSWEDKLNLLKKYVDENKIRPSSKSLDKNIKRLGQWYMDHKLNYDNNIKSMSNINIRKKWEDFNEEYKKYFMTINDEWKYNLVEIKKYMDTYDIRPNSESTNDDIRYMGDWICRQTNNIKNNNYSMKNEENKRLWIEFINDEKYSKFFVDYFGEWKKMLDKISKYMDDKIEEQKKDSSIKNKNIRPLITDKNDEIKEMGSWIQSQKYFYKNKIKKMDNGDRKELWEIFMDKYNKYLLDLNSEWDINLDNLKQFIIINNYNKTPYEESQNTDEKYLGKWFSHQKRHYKNITGLFKNEDYKDKWEDFNTNYLLKIEELENKLWFEKYNELTIFISKDSNNKLPQNIKTDDNNYRELYLWSNNQKTQYKKNAGFMKNDLLKNKWLELVNKYPKSFRTLEEIWIDKLNELDNYITINKKLPDVVNNKDLYDWYKREKYHYNNTLKMLKNEEMRKLWKTFLEKNEL